MIAVFVGGRSDGGILAPLIAELDKTVQGVKVIEADGYMKADTPRSVALSAAMIGYNVAHDLNTDDHLIVLGDRYEALAAAEAAYNMGVSICHLHGGEVTTGSRDNARRHAITCLASLHLAATSGAVRRLVLSAEGQIRHTGSIGAWQARNAEADGYKWDIIAAVPTCVEVRRAVDTALEDYASVLWIGPNADHGWAQMEGADLPPQQFLSKLKGAKVIVGNTSAGIIEAPSAQTWTVNVGDRQDGREKAESVIDVECDPAQIAVAVQKCLMTPFPDDVNTPYDNGNALTLAVNAICAWSA